jgi:PhnB protein
LPVKPIPAGYHTATPYLIVKGAAAALEFYAKAFGAKERMRLAHPDGTIAHSEFTIGDSTIMLADEHPEMGIRGPKSVGGASAIVALYVADVDAQVKKSESAGAKILRPVADQFYGDRTATLEDPFGHLWSLATHVEDVSPEEIQRRFAAMTK